MMSESCDPVNARATPSFFFCSQTETAIAIVRRGHNSRLMCKKYMAYICLSKISSSPLFLMMEIDPGERRKHRSP